MGCSSTKQAFASRYQQQLLSQRHSEVPPIRMAWAGHNSAANNSSAKNKEIPSILIVKNENSAVPMSVQELLEIKDLEHQIGQEDSKQSSMVAEYSSPLVHMHSANYLSVDDREGARCPTPSPLQEEKEIQIKKEEDEELEIADVSDDQYEELSDGDDDEDINADESEKKQETNSISNSEAETVAPCVSRPNAAIAGNRHKPQDEDEEETKETKVINETIPVDSRQTANVASECRRCSVKTPPAAKTEVSYVGYDKNLVRESLRNSSTTGRRIVFVQPLSSTY